MKSLKFKSHLVEQIREGKKTSTLRLFDDKDIQAGDELELVADGVSEPFARAVVTAVAEKPLGSLSDEDWVGQKLLLTTKKCTQPTESTMAPKLTRILWLRSFGSS